jgi:hypothetical protein
LLTSLSEEVFQILPADVEGQLSGDGQYKEYFEVGKSGD